MLLTIDPTLKESLYVQIYELIKEKIHQKEFKTHEKLPSKRQLAKINNISENTVTNAYNQLLVEGYIYSIERKGYYVSNIEFHSPLLHLEDPHHQPKERKITKQAFDYDFTRSNPDQKLFPYSIFTKLYRQLFQEPDDRLIGESDGQGLYPLRQELQHYLSLSRGVPCSPEQIILGPSSEYLLAILFQLLDEDLHIAVENPGYQGFQALMHRAKIPYSAISLSENGLNLKELSQSEANLVLVTSNHQFPTGKIMPLKERQDLLNWANAAPNRYIVENDYDSEFKYSGIPIPSLKYLDQSDRVIHMASFTRVLSPGIRLAYMVLPDRLVEKYQQLFSTSSSNLSSFEQWILHDFMAAGHLTSHLNRSRTFYKKKRDQMIQAIKKQDENAEIYGEKAGLHLLVKMSFSFDGALFKKMAAERKIKLKLLSDYSFDLAQDAERFIFLSFSSIPEPEIEQVIANIFAIAQLAVIK